MSSISLNTYNNGDTNYIAKMNADNAALQTAVNNLLTTVEGSGSPLSFGTMLLALFGFTGSVIGNSSYAVTPSGSNLAVNVGYCWKPSTTSLLQNSTATTLSFGGQTAGTYYVSPDNNGNPTFGTTATDALYSVVWTGTAFGAITFIGNKFMSAADETGLLTSTALSTVYSSILARFEAIETALRKTVTTAPDTGAANAYVVAPTPTPIVAAGFVLVFKPANSNNGPSTISVSGTVYTITKNGEGALNGGELVAGQICLLVFDGTDFQILSGSGGGGGSVTPPVLLNTPSPTTIGISIQGDQTLASSALAQSVTANSSAASFTLAFTSNNTAGNCLVLAVAGGSTAPTITDTLGNTYVQVNETTIPISGQQNYIFVAQNCLAGANTITVANAGSDVYAVALEYNGIAEVSAVDTDGGQGGYNYPGPTNINLPDFTASTSDMLVTFLYCGNSLVTPEPPAGTTTEVSGVNLLAASGLINGGTYDNLFWSVGGGYNVSVAFVALKQKVLISQSADLLQFLNPNGVKISGVNAQGQVELPITPGVPTNTPPAGTLAFDSISGGLVFFNGSSWLAVPLGAGTIPAAISNTPDFPPVTPTVYDDEFTGSTLNTTLWTKVIDGTGTVTINVAGSYLGINTQVPPSGDNFTVIAQPIPATPYTITAKIDLLCFEENFSYAGLCLMDTSGKIVALQIQNGDAIHVNYWTNNSTYSSAAFTSTATMTKPRYFKIEDDGTNLTFFCSLDGVNFIQLYQAARTSFLSAPAYMGIMGGSNQTSGTYQSITSCDWFRRTA